MTIPSHSFFDGLDIVATKEVGTNIYEVCGTCEAGFDENTSKLCVELEAFVRRFEMRGKDEISRPPWLPRSETVRMDVDREEASDAAKEIFANWVKRVRLSIPTASEWVRHPEWLQTEKEKNEDHRQNASPCRDCRDSIATSTLAVAENPLCCVRDTAGASADGEQRNRRSSV